MATYTVTPGSPAAKGGNIWNRAFTFVVTGTYTTSGDTLDLSAVSPIGDGRPPIEVRISGTGTTAGVELRYEKGTTAANGKVWIYTNSAGGSNSVMTEHTNAAVVAGVSDTTWRAVASFGGGEWIRKV